MQAKEVARAKFAKAFSAHISWGNQAVRLPVPPLSTGERGAPGLVSTSGTVTWETPLTPFLAQFSPCLHAERAMMPKLFRQLRAFPFGRYERTFRTQTHVHRLRNTRTWQTTIAQPANRRKCSRSVCRRFIVGLCVFWGIKLTRRSRCRKHSWLLTNICTNSMDSRRCPLG
jgi:hypothetical protein